MSHTLPAYIELRRKVATLTRELAAKDVLLDEAVIGILAIQERAVQVLGHVEESTRNINEVSLHCERIAILWPGPLRC